jgi:membrane associated rhomboid family serine protease
VKLRITYNAPVVLTFTLAAVAVFVLTSILGEQSKAWFAAWPKLVDARSYVGLVTHILGHANWEHLLGNFMLILLIGPILEERHGSASLLAMIIITALVTGLVTLLLGKAVMGASGIVFMMILLASMANVRGGEIPLTFIAVAVIYMGGEVVHSFRDDGISHMAHLVGGAVGALFGFLAAKPRQPGIKGGFDKLDALDKPKTPGKLAT